MTMTATSLLPGGETDSRLLQVGLRFERGTIERDLVTGLELDCKSLFLDPVSQELKEAGVSEGNLTVEDAGNPISFRLYPLAVAHAVGGSSLIQVIDEHHPYPEHPDAAVAINKQAPKAVQNIHHDGPAAVGETVVVHATDDGAFDYYPRMSLAKPERASLSSIERVMAGDKVTLSKLRLWHGGRNPSDHERFNVLLYVQRTH